MKRRCRSVFILQVPFLRTGDGWSKKIEQGGSEAGNGAEWLDKNKEGEGEAGVLDQLGPSLQHTPPFLVPVNNVTPDFFSSLAQPESRDTTSRGSEPTAVLDS